MVERTYHIEFVEHPGYLHATVTGKNTKGNIIRYLSEIHEECIKRGFGAILVEENLVGSRLGAFDLYDVVRQGSKVVHPMLKFIAFADVSPQNDLEAMKFAQTIAVNRLVNIRVFQTVEEAASWLKSMVRPEETPDR